MLLTRSAARPPCPPRLSPCPAAPTLSLRGAVMPEDRFACGENGQQKNEFAFLNGTQCGNRSRRGFRCRSAPQRGCVKRQHRVCWRRARPVSPGCPCVPGNRGCRARPGVPSPPPRCHEQGAAAAQQRGACVRYSGGLSCWMGFRVRALMQQRHAEPGAGSFPSSAPQISGGGAGGAGSSPHPAVSGACPRRPEPSLPGTAGRPATISRLLIPRDKSRSLTPPEEEKRRALGREQQTRRWIRCSLPAWVSHEFPRVTRGGTEPAGAGGTRGGNGGELVVQGLGSPWCIHPPPPARPSQLPPRHGQAAQAGLWRPRGTPRHLLPPQVRSSLWKVPGDRQGPCAPQSDGSWTPGAIGAEHTPNPVPPLHFPLFRLGAALERR